MRWQNPPKPGSASSRCTPTAASTTANRVAAVLLSLPLLLLLRLRLPHTVPWPAQCRWRTSSAQVLVLQLCCMQHP